MIVVNYRSGDALAHALRAARGFGGPEARLTVVDNSPEDGAATAARAELPDVRVIESETNVGFAVAVNRALAETSAPLVLLLNPDVSSIEGSLESVEESFAADPRVAALGARLRNHDGTVQPSARREPRSIDLFVDGLGLRNRFPRWKWPRRAFQAEEGGGIVDTVFGACLFIRRAALDDIGPFDERFFVYAEETDWLVRAKRRGWKTVVSGDVQAVHRLRGSTDTSEETLSLLLLESNYAYSAKHLGRARTLALRLGLGGADSARWVAAALRAKREHRCALEGRLAVHAGRGSPGFPRRRG